MKTEMTRERLLEALENLRRAAGTASPYKVDAPDFIEAMSDHEVFEWDVALYELALEGLAAREAARIAATKCPECGGKGRVDDTYTLEANVKCDECGGTGERASAYPPACNAPTATGSPGLGCSRVEGHEGEHRS